VLVGGMCWGNGKVASFEYERSRGSAGNVAAEG